MNVITIKRYLLLITTHMDRILLHDIESENPFYIYIYTAHLFLSHFSNFEQIISKM
jgi:hypothetical protein